MNKFLYSILLVFSSFSVYAQSQDSIGQIQTLVQRVDSLEHELSYLKLTYELKSLNSEMSIFAQEISSKAIEIQLYIYNRNFDYDLYDSYKRYYKLCMSRKETFKELINAEKYYFTVKVVTFPFSENEMEVLMSNYRLIDDTYEVIEKSIDYLKIVVNTYRDLF